MGSPASVPRMRSRWVLRRVAEQTCDGALPRDQASGHHVGGGRRDVGLLLPRRPVSFGWVSHGVRSGAVRQDGGTCCLFGVRRAPVASAREHHGAREWLLAQRSQPIPKFRLFCFPYAGGGTTIFHGWGAELPPEVEVLALRLPGRGNRLSEPSITQMSVLVDTLVEVLEPELGATYGFFGHSMGGRIAFELTRALSRCSLPLPAKLWISGSRAPQVTPRRRPVHDLPETEFLAELRQYGGVPAGVFENEELLRIYVPIL